MYDATIGQYQYDQFQVPAYDFARAHNDILNLNETVMEDLAALNQQCGYTKWTEHYLQFPPPEHQPPVIFNPILSHECNTQQKVILSAYDMNPCFSFYNIIQQCPAPTDVLTNRVFDVDGTKTNYFDRIDVKRALHVPQDIKWEFCSSNPVFTGKDVGQFGAGPEFTNDTSPDPIQHALPKVIEATNRVLISNGDWDLLVMTNGTLLEIQNMTWNGKLGFQAAPTTPIVISDLNDSTSNVTVAHNVDAVQGTMGVQHFERGLMWCVSIVCNKDRWALLTALDTERAETFQCGHAQPEYQPRVTFQHLLWLLGRIETL